MNIYNPSSDVGSTSTHALRLQSLSNVGEPGLWVFRVGEGDIQSGGEYGTKGRPRSHAPLSNIILFLCLWSVHPCI